MGDSWVEARAQAAARRRAEEERQDFVKATLPTWSAEAVARKACEDEERRRALRRRAQREAQATRQCTVLNSWEEQVREQQRKTQTEFWESWERCTGLRSGALRVLRAEAGEDGSPERLPKHRPIFFKPRIADEAKMLFRPSRRAVTRNDAGFYVSPGSLTSTEDGRRKYFCGQASRSGRCGPFAGPQCASCQRLPKVDLSAVPSSGPPLQTRIARTGREAVGADLSREAASEEWERHCERQQREDRISFWQSWQNCTGLKSGDLELMRQKYPPYGLSPQVLRLPLWIQRGCGDAPYYSEDKNAVFPHPPLWQDGAWRLTCPLELPDLTKHNNCLADFFDQHPDEYKRLRVKETSQGVTLAHCIKTGVDNPTHGHIKTVGVTAGDEESYVVFKELFDAVIAARHSGYAADGVQPTDLDASKLLDTDIDPYNSYVLTTRVRTGRSVRGFRLPPTIGFEERRKLESICVNGLLHMTGELKGDYFPLHGSQSYAPKPNGMTSSDEAHLRSHGVLFQEPDSTLLLSSGMGRHWPDARGIFCNEARNFFVWVGEEDHLRIVSMQGDKCRPTRAGKQIKQVFVRFLEACAQVRTVIQKDGYDFMWNRHHGWILTCPSNLGTGLRVGVLVRLPRLSALPEFRKVLAAMGLQARGANGIDSAASGGVWDVSNADRIGKSEVELCNVVICGSRQLVDWEHLLQTATSQNGNGPRVAAEIADKL